MCDIRSPNKTIQKKSPYLSAPCPSCSPSTSCSALSMYVGPWLSFALALKMFLVEFLHVAFDVFLRRLWVAEDKQGGAGVADESAAFTVSPAWQQLRRHRPPLPPLPHFLLLFLFVCLFSQFLCFLLFCLFFYFYLRFFFVLLIRYDYIFLFTQ